VTRTYYPIQIPSWGKEVDSNLFPDSSSLLKARTNHTDSNSLYGDPLFINSTTGDYKVSDKSPARLIGFKNIDDTHIGVQGYLQSQSLKVTIPYLVIASKVKEKTAEVAWLDVVIRNVSGLGDRSAFGLSSENGVIIVSVKTDKGLAISGLQPNDVLLAADDKPINNIFDLFNHYQKVNWMGKMKGTIMRSQQIQNINIQLK
jgi:S1-C subfamily serine protease